MNPYTEPGWEKALKELEVLVGSSGIAWVAGLDLKGERSAVLAAAIYELHARLAERDKRIREYEESEASVCPEDVGFVEFIGVLQKRIAGLERALIGVTPSHRVKGKCWCPIAVDTGVTHSKACQAARAALAAQPLAPSKCECHIERNPSRMSAAALESGASAEIVGPLCAFCRANARKPPAPGATDGERLDWLEKHGSEIDRPVEHETGVKHTGLCWYPDPFEDKELFIQGENLRAAIDAAIRAERGGK